MFEKSIYSIFCIGRKNASGVNLLGTAFAIRENAFATASHVIGTDDTNLVLILSKINSLSDYQDTTNTKINTFDVKIKEFDPVRDIAIIEAEGTKLPYMRLGSAADLNVGDPVKILGFPHANYGRLVLTLQSTDVGAKIKLGSKGIKTNQLVLNIYAREGQSGGPVFNLKTGTIAAMLIGSYAPGGGVGLSLGGVNPHTLHQTTHAISAEYIENMLK